MDIIDIHEVLTNRLDTIYDELGELAKTHKFIQVKFPNGKIKKTTIKHLIINLFVFEIMLEWEVPFDDFVIGKNEILDPKLFGSIIKKIYIDVILKTRDYSVFDRMCDSIWRFVNKLMNFTIIHCTEYVSTIDLPRIIDYYEESDFKDILKLDEWKKETHLSVRQMEKKDESLKKKLIKYLKKTDNPFSPYLRINMLNETQLYNLLVSVGYKTDIDDEIIPYYIKSSYLEGLNSNIEYVLESLASKKSMFYNKSGIGRTRYFERMIQLACMSIKNVYPGDCGTNVTIPFEIHEENIGCMFGTTIIENGKLISLTDENLPNYLGKVVNIRSPLTCRHTDGFCETCGGLMTYFFPRRFGVGFVAAVNVIEPVSQKILSSKHYQQTSAVQWKQGISNELFKYFIIKENQLYVSDYGRQHRIMVDNYVLNSIINVHYLDIDEISEINLPRVKEIVIFKDSLPVEEGYISLEHKKIAPIFTRHFIEHVKKHKNDIKVIDKKHALINLKNFPLTKPIMRIDFLNDSMVKFVDDVRSLFENNIAKYTNLADLLRDASNLIFPKVKVNIMYLAAILKAFMITSNEDYSIPVVERIDNVMFDTIVGVNLKRTLGNMICFERHKQVITDPLFYLVARQPSDFDELLNLKWKDQK